MRAFQLTDEYNNVLFSWYFKGFELLRSYLTKHNPRVNLEDLDFEVIDKEIMADEAAATATGCSTLGVERDAPLDDKAAMIIGDDAPLV